MYQILFLSLGRQEIKITIQGKKTVLFSALKWRVAIVAKRNAPVAKPATLSPIPYKKRTVSVACL